MKREEAIQKIQEIIDDIEKMEIVGEWLTNPGIIFIELIRRCIVKNHRGHVDCDLLVLTETPSLDRLMNSVEKAWFFESARGEAEVLVDTLVEDGFLVIEE